MKIEQPMPEENVISAGIRGKSCREARTGNGSA